MVSSQLILAALTVLSSSEELDIGKLLFYGIAILIWIISAVVKSLGSKPKNQQTGTGDEWNPDASAGQAGREWTPPPPATQPVVQAPTAMPGSAEWYRQNSPYAPTPPPYTPQQLPRQVVVPQMPQAGSRPPPIPRRKKKAAAAVARAVEPEEPSAYKALPAAKLSAADTPRREVSTLDAKALRRWMTPKVMRQQYILTELLDPPPSIRDSERPL